MMKVNKQVQQIKFAFWVTLFKYMQILKVFSVDELVAEHGMGHPESLMTKSKLND